MNKRFGLFSLVGGTVLLLALVGAMAALAAPSAATVTGTISVDKSWYKVGGTVKITVVDKDSTDFTDANVNIGGAGGLAALTTKRLQLANRPITGTPTAVSLGTTTLVSGLDILVVSVSEGVVDVLTSVDRAANFLVDIKYSAIAAQSVSVKVTSDQDPLNPITVTAPRKTGAAGEFEVSITIVDATDSSTVSSSTAKTLRAANTGVITAEYSDAAPATGVTAPAKVNAKATVETLKPAFSNLLPADKFSTKADGDKITISGSVSDTGGSGVKKSKIKVVVDTFEFDPTVTGSDGDASVTFTIDLTKAAYETKAGSTTWVKAHNWYVKAEDVAGNPARTDAVVDVIGTSATIGDQDHTVTIDQAKPTMDSAQTGKFWDTSLATPAEDSNKLTSLVVIFSDDLDATTVTAADFTVGGAAVTAAEIFTKAGKKKVYLTLATALDPAAKPDVVLVTGATVADTAGNTQDTGKLTAAGGTGTTGTVLDKIAPSFTVSLDKTLTKDKVVITITSDEALAGLPTVTSYDKNGAAKGSGALVADPTGSKAWSATFTAAGGDLDGKWAVVVTGSDDEVPGNTGTKGKTSVTATGAIVFTLDTVLATPKFMAGTVDFTAATAQNVEDSAPLLSMDFGEKVTVDAATFGETGTTLADIKAKGSLSSDGKIWFYQASSLVVDKEYTIKVSATDAAGNKATDKSADFKVKDPTALSIGLTPGQNLVSLPGEPKDPDINKVMPADVSAVVTYDAKNPDPKTGSPWLSAVRGADGKFPATASLTKIDARHAYWVKTASTAPIKVVIPAQGFDVTPPTLVVVKGWNLLPVISVEGKAQADGSWKKVDPADATKVVAADPVSDSYLTGIRWVTAYSYDTLTNTWTKVLPRNFTPLKVTKGYWVYALDDGVVVP